MTDGIAIVGMSCRLPGAPDVAGFWRLLRDGVEAVTERQESSGESRRGGFLDRVDEFDAAFFGISPKEAGSLDPRQRLMLELSWEALENAGIVPAELAGSRTGVFTGTMWDDYAALISRHGGEAVTRHSFTGLQRGLIANRVSYGLGVRGPSITVDCGQSSSLVAVHMACESLRNGESELALAGGVNLILAPESTEWSETFGALSPDGRCFTFDARANGYVRGEGGAVVVLKPLSRALADGDDVVCVIRGSAVNNDGGGDGIAAPEAEAQEEVLRLAHRAAGVAAAEVQYVELHGTGTRTGDPVEASALGAVLGRAENRADALRVGSVKTNIGHLEGAAGIAGLVKTALSLRHRELPPSLNFETPNPDIPLAELNLRVQDTVDPWAAHGPLVAGVSSFGVGGTNCHVVLAEAPGADRHEEPPSDAVLLPFLVSGAGEPALRAQAERLASHLDGQPEQRLADIGFSLATTRSTFTHRAVVLAGDRDELARHTTSLAQDVSSPAVVRGTARTGRRVVFVFPGQGSQWAGMGVDLLESSEVFADAMHAAASAVDSLVDWSVLDVLRSGTPSLDRVDVVQPVLWAMMVSLAELWRSFGVVPDAVVGHSQGEIAAACVSGALSLDDAAHLVVSRSRALTSLAGGGGMLSVQLPEPEVRDRLAGWDGRLSVAAVNGPHSVVVAGVPEALDELAAELTSEGARTRRIAVDYASHTAQVEQIRSLLDETLSVTPVPASVPLYSTVTGQPVDHHELDGDYWYRNLRRTVRFEDAIRALGDAGHDSFIEISPHPVLTGSVQDIVEDAVVAGSLRRGEGDTRRFLTSLAEVHVRGVPVRWAAAFPAHRTPRRVPLPTYAFQRRRHWFDSTPAAETAAPSLRDRIAALPANGRGRMVADLVLAETAVVLGHDSPGSVEPDRSFRDSGFDSVMATELRNRLVTATGLRLPASLLFDHPTPTAVARHLHDELLDLRPSADAPAEQSWALNEPIAVVGMAARYPGGVASPEDLWDLVAGERDVIGPFPLDRGWDPELVKSSSTSSGGFLHDVAGFDAGLFGISPREALAMDPQQRVLLETSWEALERAGIDPSSVHGSRTGVFVGAMSQGYVTRLASVPSSVDGHVLTGNTASVLSGRLAYVLGLVGPAVTVDTACSSSLVALHLAVQSLRVGECSLALAGGVAVMSAPDLFVEFSHQRGLATDGRCKSFAATADGTGWGEGAGLLVLERLSDAQRNGHKVLAVVRGSAVNQDGASNGLTAPNGPSQERVIRQALANAGLSTNEVDAIEAHGTGTVLGDPIEANALLATYGQDRDRPLWLGSVKSNIGHTQAAAGVAGVIKMVLAMKNGLLPRTLHVDEPTPHVDWAAGDVQLLTEAQAWPENGYPRRAGVSSFGISGTNAHVVLEQAPSFEAEPVEQGTGGLVPWVVSARSEVALKAQVDRVLAECRDVPAVDVGWSLASTRASLEHRAVLLDGAEVVEGVASSGGVVWVFPGQGSQWVGMARGLVEWSPVFAESLLACDRALSPWGDWSVFDALADEGSLARVDVVQPVLWAVMVSLGELWRSFGVTPDAVIGHSQGEVAAACAAGVLSLEDGARIVALRSQIIHRSLSGRGVMVSVALPADELSLVEGVSVAAVNGPRSTVLSGRRDAMEAVLAGLGEEVRVRWLPVDYASHGPDVELVEDEILTALEPVRPRSGQVPLYSTVTGTLIDGSELDAGYWYRNLRQTVRFDEAVAATGYTRFVEISPHPVLAVPVEDVVADAVVIGSLRRDQDDRRQFVTALARAWVAGVDVDWASFFPGGRVVDLPTYPFQRERYWLEGPERRDGGSDAFWDAVAREDLDALAAMLRLDKNDLNSFLPALSSWLSRRTDTTTVDSWRYRVTWKPVSVPAMPQAGTWLLVGKGSEADWCAETALAQGIRTVRFAPSDDRGELAAGLGAAEELTGVLAVGTSLTETVALVQALGDAGIAAPVWCVTSGAVATGQNDAVRAPEHAMLWGLGRVVGLEQPERWGGLIDLPEEFDDRAATRLWALVTGNHGEDQLAIRAAGVFARRLVRAPLGDVAPKKLHGTALVTGGTGPLGAHVARWLVEQGIERLILVSRRGLAAPGADDLAAELSETGVRVTIAACDAADRAALAELLPEDLTTVVHAAAVLDDAMVDALTPAQIERSLRAKVDVARNLHELTEERDLSAFILFSSIASTVGIPGQGNYAPGNAFLDALAEYRHARGLAATSVAWGPWDGDGMAALGSVGELLHRHGIPAMAPELATTALRQAVGAGETAVTVADVVWDRFLLAYSASRPTSLFQDIPEGRTEPDTPAPSTEFAKLPEPERHRALLELVRTQVAVVLGHSAPEMVKPDHNFKDLGLDSLTGVDLRNRLAAATGLKLSTGLAFDYPTPTRLARHLGAELAGERVSVVVSAASVADEPIAVVGMACRYPGGVSSPEDLWRVIAGEHDVISEFPVDRDWDLANLFHPDPDQAGTSYASTGGFLYDMADFDAELFGISPREALAMDPQQRLLLETSWEAFERAGVDPLSLHGSQTGVFIGMTYQDYVSRLSRLPDAVEGHVLTGNTASVASGRLAYTFGLSGPAVTVDTACSSSLVAMHLAGQALRSGECSMALAGGVAVMAAPDMFVEFSRQRGLSADGRCKPFSAHADGFGSAEGVGVLVLERLSDARRNGHRVLAVVRGSAVNQDGASNGLTAPNGPSQEKVIRQALANAGLSTNEVDAVEAHGTGTALGDPIEANALLATYGQDRDRPLWLGSVKSNIGHTQAAAGVAGVIKMVLAMRHGELPRSLHSDEPTPHVDWSAGEVRLLTEAQPWPVNGHPRRAGVSSFGMSGTNVHVVLEQAPDEVAQVPTERDTTGAVPWVVSAGSEPALRAQVDRVLAECGDLPAADVGWSLASSRASLAHRAVLLDGSVVAEGAVSGDGVAWVFPGQGSQWVGMARGLVEWSPVFAESLRACDHALSAWVDWSVFDAIENDTLLSRVDVVQPVLWAVMVSLGRLWQSFGVTPDAVIGHSQGEVAAACVAGVLSLEDGARIVALRSQIIHRSLSGRGVMVSVALPAGDLSLTDDVSVAAVNGPYSTVLSGRRDAVEAVLAGLGEDVRVRWLPVDYASHGPDVELVEDEILTALEPVRPQPGQVPMYSTVTGTLIDGSEMDAPYWYRNLRQTVQFDRAVAATGQSRFIEVSPHPVLTAPVLDAVADGVAIGTLRRDQDDQRQFVTALARAWVAGIDVDWAPLFPDARVVDLPTYAFQRERYWLEGDDNRESVVDKLRYRTVWRPMTGAAPTTTSGRWLLVGSAGRQTDDIGQALASQGVQVERLEVDERDTDRARLVERLREVNTGGPFTGVLSTAAMDEHPHPDFPTTPVGYALTVALVQALGDAEVNGPLWCVTSGAVAVDDGDRPNSPLQALVWGFGRVVALEHPDIWGGLIDLSEGGAAALGGALALASGGDEDQLAVRADGVFVRRLTRAPIGRRAPVRTWSPEGTVLVTGGTGALGTHVARWLARDGATNMIIASRRGPDAPGAAELRSELAELGCTAEIAACDVADREALAKLLAGVPEDRPLTAVVHTAAVLDDTVIASLSTAQLDRALRAKMGAAINLHELTRELDLSAFVLFSSFGGTFGVPGQGNYAPGNAFLDALAAQRRADGLVATSVAWGAWAGGGMAEGEMAELTVRHGLPTMAPELTIGALQQVLDHDETCVVVARIEWDRFHTAFTAARPSPLLEEIQEVRDLRSSTSDGGSWAGQLRDMSPAGQARVLLDLVRGAVVTVLNYRDLAQVEAKRAFRDMGFDSVTGVELRNRLNAVTGLKLPTTVIFEHSTPEALAEHLRSHFAGEDAEPVAEMLDELDRIEVALSALPLDETERTRIGAKLSTLVARWGGDRRHELDTATDDELFAYVDRNYGDR